MKIFLDTYGCTLNKADSIVIQNVLSDHEFVPYSDSELVILNTCAVKNATESRMRYLIERYCTNKKKIIVAGCLPKINSKIIKQFGVSAVDCNSYNHLPEAIQEIQQGKTVMFVSDDHKCKLDLLSQQDNSETAIVPIAEGCLGACAYCATRHARGTLTSYKPEKIVELVKMLAKDGKKTILLTAQDTGCYGFDISTNLAELLEEIVQIDGEFKVRVGMMNPQHAKCFLPQLIAVFRSPKITKFLHVPVQSGSDKVLKDMKRGYTAADFIWLVEAFRKEIPDIYISTDIIVGFPTENDADFEQTLELVRKVKPDKINSSQFYPRPNTPAKEMKQLQKQEKKARSVKLLTSLK